MTQEQAEFILNALNVHGVSHSHRPNHQPDHLSESTHAITCDRICDLFACCIEMAAISKQQQVPIFEVDQLSIDQHGNGIVIY